MFLALLQETRKSRKSDGLAVKMRTKQLQKKGAQTSEEVLSLFSFRRKM